MAQPTGREERRRVKERWSLLDQTLFDAPQERVSTPRNKGKHITRDEESRPTPEGKTHT
jgi:hypothetical protein